MKKNFWWIAAGTLITILIGFLIFMQMQPSKYDEFAQCIEKSGTVFYGAFWCSHCQSQKADFGRASKYLPYVECSTSDGKGQTLICKEKGVKSYPTWIFADGTIQTGEVSLEELAEKTACTLPL